MSNAQHQIGRFGRLRLRVGALFGDETAKQCQEALRRLDDASRYIASMFADPAFGDAGRAPEGDAAGTLRDALGVLKECGGAARGPAAAALADEWGGAEQDGRERLYRGYGAVRDRQASEALAEANALDALRQTTGDLALRVRAVVEAHLGAQREAWDMLLTSGAAARAGRLVQALDSLPDIPALPKPDVRVFAEPYEQAIALVPVDYREGDLEAICFDADAVRALVTTAVREAAGAEEALTRYLYDAAQGYEAALGRDRAVQLLQLLRDPAAVRELRTSRPELFESVPAVAGFADVLPLVLVTAILAEHAPAWHAQPPSGDRGDTGVRLAAGGGTGTPAGGPAASQTWLSSLQVPSAAELQDVVQQFDAGDTAGINGGDDVGYDSDDDGGDEGDV